MFDKADKTKATVYDKMWSIMYDYNLATRFVSDYKIPIDGCDQANLNHSIDLYEDAYGARTKWRNLVCNVSKLYEGENFAEKASKFLQEYYTARDAAIIFVEQSDAFQRFNKMPLPFSTNEKGFNTVCGSKGIYNMQNVGRRFISIDMRNANFQTLKKVGVIEADTYRDFLSEFCSGFMLDYISESKYSRQVIFGKLNPSRTISVEKHLMRSLAMHILMELGINPDTYKFAAFNSDEIVMFSDGDDSLYGKVLDACAPDRISPVLDVKIEEFVLKGYEFSAVRFGDYTKHKLGEFYRRSIDPEGIYKGMPLPFHKYLHRLMSGQDIDFFDKVIMQSGCTMQLLDDLVIDEVQDINQALRE